jgi:hypothetical protein
MTLDSMAIVKHHLSVPTWYHHSHSLDVVLTVADSPLCLVISYSILLPSDHCHILSVFNMFFLSIHWSDIMHYVIAFYKIYQY